MRKQATLPDSLRENTIERMQEGERGYTVPWAVWCDADRMLWINGQYTIHTFTGGTVQLEVTRTMDGVKVSQRGLNRMSPQAGPSYVGCTMNDMLPVEEIVR